MFSRGSGPGFLAGIDHQRLVEGKTCDHRGLLAGESLGTVRGRFGYLWFPSLLLYGTGGVAYGQNKINSAAVCPAWTPPCNTASQTSNTSVGGTLGTGAEWRFAPAWSLRAEYLYVDFGRHSDTISYAYGANVSTLTSAVRERDNIVRFGVNYLIGY